MHHHLAVLWMLMGLFAGVGVGLIDDLWYRNIVLAQQWGGGKWWLVLAGGGHAW